MFVVCRINVSTTAPEFVVSSEVSDWVSCGSLSDEKEGRVVFFFVCLLPLTKFQVFGRRLRYSFGLCRF